MFMVVMLLIYAVLQCLYSVGNKITTTTTTTYDWNIDDFAPQLFSWKYDDSMCRIKYILGTDIITTRQNRI